MPQLTEHFTLEELITTSHTAFDIQQKAGATVFLPSLFRVAVMLEQVRAHYNKPIIIHSGYRCKALNAFIGGAKTSQHQVGEAVDFHIVGIPLQQVFDWIRNSNMDWGQLILEGASPTKPSWIHLSLRDDNHHNQVLTFDGKHYHKLENT